MNLPNYAIEKEARRVGLCSRINSLISKDFSELVAEKIKETKFDKITKYLC